MTDPILLLKAAMEMYQAQYTATDKLWAYFSTVSLVLVAYTISSDKVTRVFPEALAAVAAYLMFCVGNFSALAASQRQLQTLAEVARRQGAAHGITDSNFPVFTSDKVGSFYWAVVGVIVLASLGLAWHRGRVPTVGAK